MLVEVFFFFYLHVSRLMFFPCSGKLADIQIWSIHLLAAGFCPFLVDRFLQVNECVVKKILLQYKRGEYHDAFDLAKNIQTLLH